MPLDGGRGAKSCASAAKPNEGPGCGGRDVRSYVSTAQAQDKLRGILRVRWPQLAIGEGQLPEWSARVVELAEQRGRRRYSMAYFKEILAISTVILAAVGLI